jgi:predicted kinase
MSKKPIVFIMCGPSGCGKSTVARAIAANYEAEIFASDDMRKQLYGDEAIQGDPHEVFHNLYAAARIAVKCGKNVVIDSTALGRKVRKRCMKNFDNVDFIAVSVITSEKEALRRNTLRKRQVPSEVIHRQFKQYNPPTKAEGFVDILYYAQC